MRMDTNTKSLIKTDWLNKDEELLLNGRLWILTQVDALSIQHWRREVRSIANLGSFLVGRASGRRGTRGRRRRSQGTTLTNDLLADHHFYFFEITNIWVYLLSFHSDYKKNKPVSASRTQIPRDPYLINKKIIPIGFGPRSLHTWLRCLFHMSSNLC